MVESFRLENATLGEGNVERGEKFAQRLDILNRRLVVKEKDEGRPRAFKRFCRSDVRQDHELLDQTVRFQSFGGDYAIDGAICLQQDFAFRQIEIERLTLAACKFENFVGRIKRLKDRLDQRAGIIVGAPIDRHLRLHVGKLGG